MSEIEILKKVDHPNIVKLFEVIADDNTIYLVQEYLTGGPLYDKLKEENFSEEEARKIFQQIMNSISFIHNHAISHRDIKAENFVFESKNSDNLKLIDFGLSAPLYSF